MAAGKVVADSRAALVLQEAAYPPVFYVPRADADMAMLVRTDHTTYCPYKGDCSYYSIPAGGERSANAVWSYEAPFPAVADIKGHLAFYPDRVDSIGERSEADLLPASAVPKRPLAGGRRAGTAGRDQTRPKRWCFGQKTRATSAAPFG